MSNTSKRNVNANTGGVAANKGFNFGFQGWIILIFVMCMYYTQSILSNDGMNYYAPILVAEGFGQGLIYSMNSIAGWVAIPIAILNGFIMRKSNKVNILICIGLAIVGCFWFGALDTGWELFLIFLLFQIAANGGLLMGTANLVANWFPTRKGTAMGWATLGASLSSTINPFLWPALIAIFGTGFAGMTGTLRVWGVVLIVLFIVMLVYIKCNPEDAGAFPDNDKSMSIEEAKRMREIGELYKKTSPWTVGKLLKSKQMWIISIAGGAIMLITVGLMSNLIGIILSYGVPQQNAFVLMAVSSAIGAVFSVFWGKVDAMKGTKWAAIVFYLIMAGALILLLVPSPITMFISLIFVGCALGAGNNLAVSLTATIFGRYDFDKAWSVIYPIYTVVRVGGFALVGTVTAAFGGNYKPSFIILIAICFVAIILIKFLNVDMIGRNEVTEEDIAALEAANNK